MICLTTETAGTDKVTSSWAQSHDFHFMAMLMAVNKWGLSIAVQISCNLNPIPISLKPSSFDLEQTGTILWSFVLHFLMGFLMADPDPGYTISSCLDIFYSLFSHAKYMHSKFKTWLVFFLFFSCSKLDFVSLLWDCCVSTVSKRLESSSHMP